MSALFRIYNISRKKATSKKLVKDIIYRSVFKIRGAEDDAVDI
jgi:hypothetical protein